VFLILSAKRYTHDLAEVISPDEMEGLLQFVSLIAVLLPMAYLVGDVNEYIGLGRLFDPFKIVLMIVFVSSLSFFSFLIIKISGSERGLYLSSFLAGFVNSAACTASLVEKSSKRPSLRPMAGRGIILTNTSMILKDIIIITVLSGLAVGRLLVVPVLVLILVSLLFLYRFKHGKGNISIEVQNPFAILPALKFGMLFLFISSLSHLGISYFGDHGVYAASLGGLVSTTSVSASVGLLHSTGAVSSQLAVSTVLLALALGSASKALISLSYDREVAKQIALSMFTLAVMSLFMAFMI